jgi:uncharacterized protein GlcG (DUF336 family)
MHFEMTSSFRLRQSAVFAGIALLFLFAFPNALHAQLTAADVQAIIARAVSTAASMNQKVSVAVADNEGNIIGAFVMTGAPPNTRIRSVGRAGQGLEDFVAPSLLAAESKAQTAAIFSSRGNAFTTRTASFIIQEHIPPGIDNRPGGPLYGVQFSSLLCSDIAIAGLPLGLSGDPGGMPLYKGSVAVGGVGIEGDGLYTVDRVPTDNDQPFEEVIATAATIGYAAPALIRGDNILVDGVRLPFGNVTDPPVVTLLGTLPGFFIVPPQPARPSDLVPSTLRGVPGHRSMRFPTVAGASITAAETEQVLGDAAAMANITRAAIRQPIGSNARVTMAVVDVNGQVTGIFRQQDAPIFGLDVAVQKARTAAFFARPDAGAKLTAAGFGSYVTRAAADGLPLNGSIAFSDRAIGFLHRPFFPDGINGAPEGPFSTPLADWSPFNVGLQSDLVREALTGPPLFCRQGAREKREMLPPCPCVLGIPEIPNGLQIFAGSLPLYRGTTLIGAIGISGDGIDQDDFVAAAGAQSFAPPVAMRSDQILVRGIRLPFLKFPARPTLP